MRTLDRDWQRPQVSNDCACKTQAPNSLAQAKASQASRIRELKIALENAGLLTLNQQAGALGLCRSTTWAVLRGDHKASGLSAAIVKRMLRASKLPPNVRAKILEYVEEKALGLYGHSKTQLQRFCTSIASPASRSEEADAQLSHEHPGRIMKSK